MIAASHEPVRRLTVGGGLPIGFLQRGDIRMSPMRRLPVANCSRRETGYANFPSIKSDASR